VVDYPYMRWFIFTNTYVVKSFVVIVLIVVLFYMPYAFASNNYFIKVDGNGIEGFKNDIRSYDFEFDSDKKSIVIEVDTNSSDYVTGDLGRVRLSYGLNIFHFTIHQDYNEKEFMIYAVRKYPEGFKATDQRIENYSKFQKDSRVDFFIVGDGFDLDVFDAVSLNDDVSVMLKDENNLRVRVDAKDFNEETLELVLAKKEEFAIVSKESIDRYYIQKRNLIIISWLLGVIVSILIIYFFKKSKPDI